MHTLIADDHELVRVGLKVVLQRLAPDNTVVECADFQHALKEAEEGERFDLAILDLRMPGMDGRASVEIFRSRFPDTPLIILSGRYRTHDIWEILKSGAAGFIPKNLENCSLENALRLVLAGERFIPSDVLAEKSEDFGLLGKVSAQAGEGHLGHLSRRESEVLTELLRGLPNKVIAANLKIQEVTVKLHLQNVYKKLGATNRTQAVTIALDLGWDG